jgi:hypothetical protein
MYTWLTHHWTITHTTVHTYIKHSYLPEWVNFFLDCLTMNMKALGCSKMLETLTSTTQHNFSVIYLFLCWQSTASIVTRLQAEQSGFKSPWQPEIFPFSRGAPSLLCNRYNSFFSGYKFASARDWPLLLMPRLWMSGGMPQLPLYAFIACTGRLPFSVIYLVMLSVTQAA